MKHTHPGPDLTKFLVTLSAAFLAITSSRAATVVATSLANDETLIVNTGQGVIEAANFGSADGGNSDVDINGLVHLVASQSNNGSGNDLLPSASIDSTFDGNYRSGNASTAGYTGDLLDLMGGIAGNGAPGPITITLPGLTVGNQYLFQGYWEANNFNQTATATIEGDSLAGITGVGDLGTLISYNFVAQDTTLTASLTHTGGTDNIWWQGFSVQNIPEPSRAILIGLGVLGLLVRRHR